MEIIENRLESAMAELRANIKDIVHEDSLYEDEFYLLRWLKASNMKVANAEKMLRSTAKWRKEMDVVSMYDDTYPDGWLESMPIYADAVTKTGSLAFTIQAGLVDVSAILEERGKSNMVKLMVQGFIQAERMQLDLVRNKFGIKPLTEDSLEGGLLVLDVNHFQARHLRSLQVLKTIGVVCKIAVKHFPLACANIIIINCNGVASLLVKILRPLLESPLLKIDVYGQDKSEWEDAVTDRIPAHLIRDVFGGTRPTEDKITRDVLIDRPMILSYARDQLRISME